jgi:hypothetical protein
MVALNRGHLATLNLAVVVVLAAEVVLRFPGQMLPEVLQVLLVKVMLAEAESILHLVMAVVVGVEQVLLAWLVLVRVEATVVTV